MSVSKPYDDHVHAPRWMRERLRVLRLIDKRIASLEELAAIAGHKSFYPFAELRALREEVEEGRDVG